MVVEQVKNIDLTSVAPHVAGELADARLSRRRTVLGRAEDDVVLRIYIEDWLLAVERDGNTNYLEVSADNFKGDPIVTVGIRSDGSIERVVIDRSSGQPGLDEAVRRIIRTNERHSAFPSELARRYDVIEIRRLWNFDGKLRILDVAR
jgi:TonB family protein